MTEEKKSFWDKTGIVKEEMDVKKVVDDIDAILDFLKDIDIHTIIPKLERMKTMSRYRGIKTCLQEKTKQ